MPCWYFEKDDLIHSPSEGDGINFQTEMRYREEGAGFVIELAHKLEIPYDTYAAAVVYFHRFYMLQSFRNFHRHVMATSCLLLSSKMQNNKVTLQDLLVATKTLLSEKQFTVFGADPRQEVVQNETVLLETLRFDLEVVHPYAYLVHYTRQLKGSQDATQQLLHMAWTFINDSLYTTLCVEYEPDLLAVAFLYLACRLSKFEVSDWHGRPADFRGKWYENLASDMNLDILKDICHQVLALYSRGQTEEKLVSTTTRRSFSRNRSLSPIREQRRKRTPSLDDRRRERRRSPERAASPVRRREHDSRRLSSRRDRDSRDSRSLSKSRRRKRSYTRSPDSPRKRWSPRKSSSIDRAKAVVVPTDSSTCFLSKESFEEIQAQLRARAGPLPSEPVGVRLPPPTRFGVYTEPPPFMPPAYAPHGFHPTPTPVVVTVSCQPGAPLPAGPGIPYQPGVGFPHRPPGPSAHHQIIPVPHPTMVSQAMMTLPPPHPHNPEIQRFVGPPPTDVGVPFPPNFEGPHPPAYPNYPPASFSRPDLPPHMALQQTPPYPGLVGLSPQFAPGANYGPPDAQGHTGPTAGVEWRPESKKKNVPQRFSNLIYTT